MTLFICKDYCNLLFRLGHDLQNINFTIKYFKIYLNLLQYTFRYDN